MIKRPPQRKAEIILCVLAVVSIIPYALALKLGGVFSWVWIGIALAMIAWGAIFVLPNLFKQMKQEQKQKE